MRKISLLNLILFASMITTTASAARLSVIFTGGSGGSERTYARAFITSTTYDGNLGGIAGADAKCQARANAASLGGTWKAIISDSTTNAQSRMKFRTKPVYDLAGRLLWNPAQGVTHSNDSYTMYIPSPFYSPGQTVVGAPTMASGLRTTELGGTATNETWSGSDPYGAAVANTHCTNWSTTAGNGFVGRADTVTQTWIYYTTRSCATATLSLYCLEDE
ncbi:MAG: DUF1554 domain-containing protein [Bdellovibrio sp.]|nr:DUF1554 domain-containing protein [Bdellovibrio sp.]